MPHEIVTGDVPYQIAHNHARSTPEQVATLGELCTLQVLKARLRQLVIAEMIEQGIEPDEIIIGPIVATLTYAGAYLKPWATGVSLHFAADYPIANVVRGEVLRYARSVAPRMEGGERDGD